MTDDLADDLGSEPSSTAPDPEELTVVAGRRSLSRQRPLAAIVVAAAILVVVGLTTGPWARTTFTGDTAGDSSDDASLDVELDPMGDVHVGDGAPALAERYNGPDNQQQRTILEEAIPGSSGELARVMAVLAAVIAAVALLRDLTPHSWVLVAALAIGCLVTVVMLRDDVISTLTTSTMSMDIGGTPHTRPTFWGALAVGASAAAGLAAAFAAAPRPADRPPPQEAGATTAPGEAARRWRRRLGWKARRPHNTF